MQLQRIDRDFTVCKLDTLAGVDLTAEFVFLSKTDAELSLVCESDKVPAHVIASEPGWRALRVCGALPFAMVGVLAGLTAVLAAAGVSIFAVSTYDTDYLFLKAEAYDTAQAALTRAGYTIV